MTWACHIGFLLVLMDFAIASGVLKFFPCHKGPQSGRPEPSAGPGKSHIVCPKIVQLLGPCKWYVPKNSQHAKPSHTRQIQHRGVLRTTNRNFKHGLIRTILSAQVTDFQADKGLRRHRTSFWNPLGIHLQECKIVAAPSNTSNAGICSGCEEWCVAVFTWRLHNL